MGRAPVQSVSSLGGKKKEKKRGHDIDSKEVASPCLLIPLLNECSAVLFAATNVFPCSQGHSGKVQLEAEA